MVKMLSRTKSSLCVFKQNNSFESRIIESKRLNEKYVDRVPIIVEISDSNKDVMQLDKSKYLVPGDLTVSQFMYVIRKRVKLSPETSIFIFFGNSLAPCTELIKNIYHQYKDEDGFLYAIVSLENTFG